MDFITVNFVQNPHFLVEKEEAFSPLLSKPKGTAPPSHAGRYPDNCSSLDCPSSFNLKFFPLRAHSSDWKGKGGNPTSSVTLQVKPQGTVPADKAAPLLGARTTIHPIKDSPVKRNGASETAHWESVFTAILKNFN